MTSYSRYEKLLLEGETRILIQLQAVLRIKYELQNGSSQLYCKTIWCWSIDLDIQGCVSFRYFISCRLVSLVVLSSSSVSCRLVGLQHFSRENFAEEIVVAV